MTESIPPPHPEPLRHIVVVGTTAWGTTLAVHLARNATPHGTRITLLTRDAAEAAVLEGARENARRLPGVRFPEALTVAGHPEAASDADLVVFVVPSRALEANVRAVAPVLSPTTVLLSATKGIEVETGRRMSEVIASVAAAHPVAVLSGPNLSHEVISGQPGSTVIASHGAPLAALRTAFHSTALRVYTSEDIVGVELGGALKNVVAIAAGMVDAFDLGDNAKAALLTRGLAEITRLGAACGADPLTFQGLAGIGDLIATAYSPRSRNRRLGEMVARGQTLDEALLLLGETAEGVTTVTAALRLAGRLGVEMPITAALGRVLHDSVPPREAIRLLMERDPRPERA